MLTLKQIIFASVLAFALLSTAVAQQSATVPGSTLTITAAAAGERVRITAPSSVVQMHVEVYAASGQKLFDQEIRGGNVFDWHLQDGQAQRLAPGDYVCVVTAKSVSGKLTQRIGTVTVEEKSVGLQTTGAPQLTVQQTQAIGPLEENAFWTIPGSEPQTPTVIANDGKDGQMIRGRGALTFRIGNFFSGIDQEQMRLTEAGDLGIGTSEPQAKLDVAGAIRAERFLVVRPAQTSQTAGDLAQTTDNTESVQPLVAGTGTQNQIAKWTDNAGTLGDSGITETVAGRVGVGITSPLSKLHVSSNFDALRMTSTSDTTPVWAQFNTSLGTGLGYFGVEGNTPNTFLSGTLPYATALSSGGGGTALQLGSAGSVKMTILSGGNIGVGTSTPTTKLDVAGDIKSSGSVTSATGSVTGNLTVDTNTLFVDAANNRVGIGTATPGAPLDVVGAINSSTQYNLGGSRMLSNAGLRNAFVGVGAGALNTGADNSFFGNNAGATNTAGYQNSFFGSSAGTANTAQGNSFFGADAGRANTGGQNNSFFGLEAGESNTSGSSNAFFGAAAGAANTTAQGNSFFGFAAGQSNSTGDQNAFFGYSAGAQNTASSNSFFGNTAGNANTTGGSNSFFGTSAGAANTTSSNNSFFGTNAGAANTIAGSSFFGNNAGAANTTGAGNAFFGNNAGAANQIGFNNSFFGSSAGIVNTGNSNSFFGKSAGAANLGGGSNSFFGASAGVVNTSGIRNSFFGDGAGAANTTASFSSFFGASAGINSTGGSNSFFGYQAGFLNTTGATNAFFGAAAGSANQTGASNTFVGNNAGVSNTSENSNTFVGASSNGAAGITNATAIGADAVVTQSDSLVLGNGVKIGVGVSAPKEKLHTLGGNIFIDGVAGGNDNGLILKSPNGATCVKLTINNAGAPVTTVIPCP